MSETQSEMSKAERIRADLAAKEAAREKARKDASETLGHRWDGIKAGYNKVKDALIALPGWVKQKTREAGNAVVDTAKPIGRVIGNEVVVRPLAKVGAAEASVYDAADRASTKLGDGIEARVDLKADVQQQKADELTQAAEAAKNKAVANAKELKSLVDQKIAQLNGESPIVDKTELTLKVDVIDRSEQLAKDALADAQVAQKKRDKYRDSTRTSRKIARGLRKFAR